MQRCCHARVAIQAINETNVLIFSLCTLFYIQELMKLVMTKLSTYLYIVGMALTAVQCSSDLSDRLSHIAHTSSPAVNQKLSQPERFIQ